MESYYILVLIAGILVAFVLLVLIVTDHNFFKAEIPPDVDQPAKLCFHHCMYTLMEILYVLEKLQHQINLYLQPEGKEPQASQLPHLSKRLLLLVVNPDHRNQKAKNLNRLGIVEEHTLIRLITEGLPACRDSRLFTKDLHFDGYL